MTVLSSLAVNEPQRFSMLLTFRRLFFDHYDPAILAKNAKNLEEQIKGVSLAADAAFDLGNHGLADTDFVGQSLLGELLLFSQLSDLIYQRMLLFALGVIDAELLGESSL